MKTLRQSLYPLLNHYESGGHIDCAAKLHNFFHISIKIIGKLFNILTIWQLQTPFRTILGAKLSNSGIPAKSCHYTTKFNSERHKMPHFASQNTQHLLKITSNSALFPQNPCTIQIKVVRLHPIRTAGESFFIINYESESKNNSAADSHTQIKRDGFQRRKPRHLISDKNQLFPSKVLLDGYD